MAKFESTSDVEATEIRRNMFSKCTVKANKRAAFLLKYYLASQGRSKDFENMSSRDLNDLLKC